MDGGREGFFMTLSDGEVILAGTEAACRTMNGRRNGNAVVNGQRADVRDRKDHDLLGARGEILLARFVNRFPTGFGNPGAKGDVSDFIQVRTVEDQRRKLIVHPPESDEQPFVLVAWASALRFELVGWIMGKDAKRKEWWSDPQGGRPAYFVPRDALRPMEELLELIRERESTHG